MEKILNIHRNLKPEIRFRLIFFVLASLIWVPVRRDTGVEVNEPYKYSIEDVGENEVVFGYLIRNFVAEYDKIGVVCKDGTVKTVYQEQRKHMKGWNDEELLAEMDSYVLGTNWKNSEKNFDIDKTMLDYCINISKIELTERIQGVTDTDSEFFYVVVGTGKDRRLNTMRIQSMSDYTNSDLWVNLVCDEIKKVCR